MDKAVVADIHAHMGDTRAVGAEEYHVARAQFAAANIAAHGGLRGGSAREIDGKGFAEHILHKAAAIKACGRGAAEAVGYADKAHGVGDEFVGIGAPHWLDVGFGFFAGGNGGRCHLGLLLFLLDDAADGIV